MEKDNSKEKVLLQFMDEVYSLSQVDLSSSNSFVVAKIIPTLG